MSYDTAFDVQPSSGLKNEPADSFADPLSLRTMELSMRDHHICFVVPAGAKIDAFVLDLPGGMLVLGALRGKVNCAMGSIIIAKGGEFQGSAEATDIFIEGKVTSQLTASNGSGGERTKLKARGQATQGVHGITTSGGIIAVSESAVICGHLQARSYHIPLKADLKRVFIETI